MSRILLVDDDLAILRILGTVLKAEGYEVISVENGALAKEKLQSEAFDLLLSDIRMSPIDGVELLRWARAEVPDTSVIMLTAYGTVATAIEAMKIGAYDYITKPFKVDQLLLTVKRALEYKAAIAENLSLKSQVRTRYRLENIIAESPAMKKVCEMVERVAPTDATVLICGESGTGKDLVAKAIHAYSRRKDKKFLAVNCAALPEALLESEMFGHVKGAFTGASENKKGLFEAVEGGTIFLDEIGAMPLGIQGKLLRVLQEKEIRRVGANENIAVDARVLTATNSVLEDLIKEGKFREDLYYRVSTIPLNVEPLRVRREDISPLVQHFIELETPEGKEPPTVGPEVHRVLEGYAWPGNVRELENTVKHALTFTTGDVITPDVLPQRLLSAAPTTRSETATPAASEDSHQFESLRAFLQAKEKEYLQHVLSLTGGDKEKAAEALKISLATLYRKLPGNQALDATPTI